MPAPGKGIDLAIVFGPGGKGGRKKPPSSPMPKSMGMGEMGENEATEDAEEEIDPAFESAAVEFDPTLEGDTARLGAFKRAIMACMGSY